MDDTTREEIDEFFEDPAHRGIATGSELAGLLEVDEQRLRAEGRARNLRRAGAMFIWARSDVDELLVDLDEESAEEEAEDDEEEDDEDEE